MRQLVVGVALSCVGCAVQVAPPAPASGSPSPVAAAAAAVSTAPVPAGTPTPVASTPASPAAPTPARSVAPIVCRNDSTVAVPGRAFDDAGLPLPGALALGAKVADLPALQGARRRALLGDGASITTGKIEAVDVGRFHVEFSASTWEQSIGYLAGAAVTAQGGLTTAEVRAWVQAMAPCDAVPDPATAKPYDTQGTFRLLVGSARQLENGAGFYSGSGYVGDDFDMWAAKAPSMWAELHGAFAHAASPEPEPPAPPTDRWLGVVGWGVALGK